MKLAKIDLFPDPFERNVYCLMGLPFDSVSESDALQLLKNNIDLRRRCFLSTPNLNWVVACLHDIDLRNSVIDSDLSIPDGMPIIWIAKLLRIPLRQRVSGSGLMDKLKQEQTQEIKTYFFGGDTGIAEQAHHKLNAMNGKLRCVGFEYPGFGNIESMSSKGTIERINNTNADFLVVSLGAKKGQAWIQRNKNQLNTPIVSHLGAVVNFIAGTVKRAPIWMQTTGIEWLWRITQEPKLAQRYFFDGLVFAKIFFLKLLPLILNAQFSKTKLMASEQPRVDYRPQTEITEILLSGNCANTDLMVLKQYLRRALNLNKDIYLNINLVTQIDSAFLGALLLLHRECRKRFLKISIDCEKNKVVARQFRFFCAEYLLGNT